MRRARQAVLLLSIGASTLYAAPNQIVTEKTFVTLPAPTAPADWVQIGGPDVTLKSASFAAPELHSNNPVSLVFEAGDDRIFIIVTNVNTPPLAHAGQSQSSEEFGVVVLDGTASSDPDGDALTYLWSQIKGEPVQLSSPRNAEVVFAAPTIPRQVAGSLTLQFALTVWDAGGLSDSKNVSVMVTPASEGRAKKPQMDADHSYEFFRAARRNAMAKSEYDEAESFFKQGKFKEALRACEKTIMLKADHTPAAALAGKAAAELRRPLETELGETRSRFLAGDYLGVIRRAQKAKEWDPLNKEAAEFMSVAILALESGARILAPAAPQKKAEKSNRDSERSRILYMQGLAHYSKGMLKEASYVWKKAMGFDPANKLAVTAYNRVASELNDTP